MNTMALGSTGGIELTAFQMARELAARGHPVSVLGTGGGDLEQSFRAFAEHVSVHGNFQHTLFSPGQLRAPGDLVRWSLQMTSAVGPVPTWSTPTRSSPCRGRWPPQR
jgi:hypothetical protein